MDVQKFKEYIPGKITEFSDSNSRKSYVVRAGESNRSLKLFLNNNFVGIDYDVNIDVKTKSRQQIQDYLISIGIESRSARRASSQIELFKQIKINDIVLTPGETSIHVGVVKSDVYFKEGKYPNRVDVRWIKEIEKNLPNNRQTIFETDDFNFETLDFRDPRQVTFLEGSILALKQNGNEPMSASEIYRYIEENFNLKTFGKTPEATLSSQILKYSDNSEVSRKYKKFYFHIVSSNPHKFILLDSYSQPGGETQEDNKKNSTIKTKTYLSIFWSRFLKDIQKYTNKFNSYIKKSEDQIESQPVRDGIFYRCKITREYASIDLYFKNKIKEFNNILRYKNDIQNEFGQPLPGYKPDSLIWIRDENESNDCRITLNLPINAEDPLNRQEVLRFFTNNFPRFEEILDSYVEKLPEYDFTKDKFISPPPAYRLPEDSEIQSDRIQKFSHFRGIQTSEDIPQRSMSALEHPFKQAICITGQAGAGKTQTITEVLEKENHEFEVWEPTASATGLLSQYDGRSNSYKLGRLGKMIIRAAKNPDKLHTFVIDEAHKKSTIQMIDDELKHAISLKRTKGRRYIMKEDATEDEFVKYLEKVPGGNFKVPDNFGFIFITSKPEVIKFNPDLQDRLDFVEFKKEDQGNIKSIQDIKDLQEKQESENLP